VADPLTPPEDLTNQPFLRPRLRGVSHELAFFASPFLSVPLWLRAHTAGARLAVTIYAAAMSGLFGVSALFHRRHWSPEARLRMRRLDHSMIFLAIAGTYTAIAGLTLSRGTAVIVLGVVWLGTVAGIGIRFVRRTSAPKWVTTLPYVGLGWVAVAVLPQLLQRLGVAGFSLTVAGGALYTAGAVVYSRQAPDPFPAVFGYHEIFHALVLAGAAAHYATVAFFVLPRA
jgi:hemolysin III